MFNSGITVKALIEELREEVDIAIPIPDAAYITILNSLEQLLYTEVIQEQNTLDVPEDAELPFAIEDADLDGENIIRFEDIYTVFAGNTQLIKSTLTSGVIFPDTFYKIGNKVGFSTEEAPIKIIYFVKPALKSTDTAETDTVSLPVEFIDLVKAKLRGEVYKLANEDAIAAKWLNDYNVLLETFKAWMGGKAPQFGM